MIIKNAKIVTLTEIFLGWVELDKTKIISVNKGKTAKVGLDAKGKYLLPAYFDSHSHGGYGLDFNELSIGVNKQQVIKYLSRLAKEEGVGAILPTTATTTDKELIAFAKNWKKFIELDKQDIVKGWYIEGPFLNPEKKGAHREDLIKEVDFKLTNEISKILPNTLKLLLVAPEYKNNITKLEKLHKDFYVAIGHSNSTLETVEKAYSINKNKIYRITHLYNGCSLFDHRHPKIVNAVINNNNIYTEVITDGVHVCDDVILNTYKMLDINQIILISDSLMPKGLEDKSYTFWDTKMSKKKFVCYLYNTDKLAGSTMPFNEIVKHFKKITNCSMIDILKVSSYNAAKSLHLDDKIGCIKKNAKSNLLLLDNKCNISSVIINGNKLR